VVDVRREALDALLGRSFDGTVHVGLVYDVDTLRDSGIEDADVFLALTDSDNSNLMAVQIAKEVFDVPRAIARLDDPHREAAYRALGVSFVAGSKLVSEVFIERVHEPDFAYHLTFPTSTTQVVEMVIGDDGAGLPVRKLEVAGRLRVAALQRDGEVVIPDDATELRSGDVVVAAAVRGIAERIKRYLRVEEA
jgi:trk system potassium uptake protein TrkA